MFIWKFQLTSRSHGRFLVNIRILQQNRYFDEEICLNLVVRNIDRISAGHFVNPIRVFDIY